MLLVALMNNGVEVQIEESLNIDRKYSFKYNVEIHSINYHNGFKTHSFCLKYLLGDLRAQTVSKKTCVIAHV